MKLDISKAYDRVEWDFLRGIMAKMGFLEIWIDRVMCCVSTPSFLVCMVILNFLEDSDKETRYHLIYLFYVQNESVLYVLWDCSVV